MKVLITGGAGLLGQYLNIELSKRNDILSLYHINKGNAVEYNSACIDITDSQELSLLFESFKPAVVIHTASISNAEMAQAFPESYVTELNVNATAKIAQLCDQYNTKLIYTSTDLVYDGSFGEMLPENSPLRPVTLYAETKLKGEEIIRQTFDNYIILRTALLFGFGLNHSTNYFHKMYNNLKAGQSVSLFYDQFRTPLSLSQAAEIITELLSIDLKGEIINFGGSERISRLEMGEVLCEETGFSKDLLIKSSLFNLKNFPVVSDVSMDTAKLQNLGIAQVKFRDSVRLLLGKMT